MYLGSVVWPLLLSVLRGSRIHARPPISRWHSDGHYRLARAVLMFTKKILESIAILAAGIVGILLRRKAV